VVFVHAVNISNEQQSWLYALDENELSVRWAVVVNEYIDGWWHVDSHPLVYNNTVYILASTTGTLYAVDFEGNKRVVWDGDVVSYYTSPSAYNGKIFFAGNESGQHEFVVINESTGNVLWKYPVDGAIVGGIAIGEGFAFFTTTDSSGECKLYAVNLTDPENLSWNVALPGRNGVWRITPAVGNGYVVVGTKGDQGWTLDNNDSVLCYRVSDHELVWEFDRNDGLNGDVGGSPIIAGDYVFFTTNTEHGTLYAVYLENGSLAWSYDLKQWCMSSPFVWGGKLFVGADNGNVYAFGNFSLMWEGSVTLAPENVTISLKDGSQKEISGISALYALINASELGSFDVVVNSSTYGVYVESINGIASEGWCGWMYWVNYPEEDMPQVGADSYLLKDNDTLIWYYGCWPQTPADSEYVIKININILKPVEIKSLTVSDGERGGNATAWVNVSATTTDWYVVVVSGVSSEGEAIAGISTFRLNAGEELRVPVLIHIPQLAGTGRYNLYAGVYRFSEYPGNPIHIYGPVSCEVS